MSSNNNGHYTPIPIGVVEYETFYSGVTVHITPATTRLIQTILEDAKDLYPNPDKALFMKPIVQEVGGLPLAIEDETEFFDGKDPEYIRQLTDAKDKQNWYLLQKLIEINCKWLPDENSLIKRFAEDLARMRKAGVELPADEWEATLWFVIVGKQDNDKLFNILTDRLPVQLEDVENELRRFRLKAQRTASS